MGLKAILLKEIKGKGEGFTLMLLEREATHVK